ncbi:signal peptidase complex subunit 2 [Zophobas morio]|uniref:signal peptidase complex subunit 2 n=1 Tax=Zophobas morio TaxID=2755281 RepID=UPI0030827700
MAPKESKDKDDKPVKINKWDGSAVKNAIDDAVKEVLTKKFNYVENFALMDGRLIICSIAVGFAMFALLWDYLYPFPLSKNVLICCVMVYFLMMTILTLYTTYREKGIFAVCIQKKDGQKKDSRWEASSYLKKFDDKYKLVITLKDGKTGSSRDASLEKSVANFVDVNGSVVHEIVENEVTKLHNSLLSDRKEK